jgi:hypothetical protein
VQICGFDPEADACFLQGHGSGRRGHRVGIQARIVAACSTSEVERDVRVLLDTESFGFN